MEDAKGQLLYVLLLWCRTISVQSSCWLALGVLMARTNDVTFSSSSSWIRNEAVGNTRGGTLRQSQKVGIGLLLTGNTKWPLVVSYYTTGSNSRYLLVSFEDDRVARRKARATTSFSSLVVAISFQYRTWKPFVDLKFYCCHVASSSAVFLSWSSTTILAWLMVSCSHFY